MHHSFLLIKGLYYQDLLKHLEKKINPLQSIVYILCLCCTEDSKIITTLPKWGCSNNWLSVASNVTENNGNFFLRAVNSVGVADLKGDVSVTFVIFYDSDCHFQKMLCVFLNKLHLDHKIGKGFQGERVLLCKKSMYCELYTKGTIQ